MAISAQRRLETQRIRRFGSGRDQYLMPDLTEIQTRSYDDFLQYEVPLRNARIKASRVCCGKSSRSRATTRQLDAGVRPLRARQAALHAGRMPPVAADLRPAVPRLAAAEQGAADRRRSLPGRHADHARRRRVHHQRCRAGGGQPVAPQPRASTSSWKPMPRPIASCPAAGSFPNAAAGSKSTSPRRTA